MQVLIDAPLLLNAILKRYGGETNFSEFWEELQQKHIQGYLTETGLDYVYQHIHRWQGALFANQVNDWIRRLLTICPVHNQISQQAHGLPIGDYESAIAVVCATRFHLSAVVTDRPQSFIKANLQVLSTDDLIRRLRLERNTVGLPFVDLSQWFQGSFSTNWLPLANFPLYRQSTFNFRRSSPPLGAGKLLSLGVGIEVALVVKPALTNEGMDIWVELCTTDRQLYLPPHLTIEVLDQAGKIAMSAQPDGSQAGIRLNFDTSKGEIFSLKVSYSNVSFTEKFRS